MSLSYPQESSMSLSKISIIKSILTAFQKKWHFFHPQNPKSSRIQINQQWLQINVGKQPKWKSPSPSLRLKIGCRSTYQKSSVRCCTACTTIRPRFTLRPPPPSAGVAARDNGAPSSGGDESGRGRLSPGGGGAYMRAGARGGGSSSAVRSVTRASSKVQEHIVISSSYKPFQYCFSCFYVFEDYFLELRWAWVFALWSRPDQPNSWDRLTVSTVMFLKLMLLFLWDRALFFPRGRGEV